MQCEFLKNGCFTECPKFSICMYKSIQTQLSEINTQLNFILTTLTTTLTEQNNTKTRISLLETNVNDIISTLISLTNDSESKQNT